MADGAIGPNGPVAMLGANQLGRDCATFLRLLLVELNVQIKTRKRNHAQMDFVDVSLFLSRDLEN